MCVFVYVCVYIFCSLKARFSFRNSVHCFSICNGKDESIANPVLGLEPLLPKAGAKRISPNELFGVTPT